MVEDRPSAPIPPTGAPAARGPLADVRVLDVSPFLPGPFASQMLADLGADVIKVEPVAGDPARSLPGGLYDVANRNKRTVVLDLKTPGGQDACRRLAEGADVFIEGFRPGVVGRLGVSWADLSVVNPGLVYCSISGQGQSGPQRSVAGHDVTYLATSGALSFPGSWSDEAPRRPGLPVADLGAAAYAAVAVLACLHERSRTGRGCYLDLALADAALALASVRAGADLDNRPGDRLHLSPSNDVFATSDGYLAVGAVEEHFWNRLRSVLAEVEPAVQDPRFDSPAGRRSHGDALAALLRGAFARRSTQAWQEALSRADVPAETIRTVGEAVASEQVRARGIVQGRAGRRHVVFPALRDGRPVGELRRLPPALGADDEEVLGALAAGRSHWLAPPGPG